MAAHANKNRGVATDMGWHDDALVTARRVRRGIAFSALERFRAYLGWSVELLAGAMGIPVRTLARRKAQGRLSAEESDRLIRLAGVVRLAVNLFEGDVAGADRWLRSPNRALAGRPPLDWLDTDAGLREVEALIGRLEHGVFP